MSTTEKWATIKDYADDVIPVIRKYSKNLIVVGTPDYSYATNSAKKDLIDDENVAYTHHFYISNDSHSLNTSKAYIDSMEEADEAVFVTEWGFEVTKTMNNDAYVNGGIFSITDVDDAVVGKWIDWMAEKGLSWAFWSLSSQPEPGAILKSSASVNGGWSDDDLWPAGIYMKEQF